MQKFEALIRRIQDARQRWRWLGYALAGASFLYIVVLLLFGNIDWQVLKIRTIWQPLVASLLLYLVSLILQFLVWARIIAPYHRAGWQDLTIYGRTLLLRRLPGGVWHWVGRTAMYSESTQVPVKISLLANFLEWALLLLVAGAIISSGVTGLAPGLRILLAAIFFGLAGGLAYAWMPEQYRRSAHLFEVPAWLLIYCLAWVMGGLIVAVFSAAVQSSANPVEISWTYATWVWALTGGSSLAVIIVPSGLGIRELTLTWILGNQLGTEPALLVALMIRISFLIADLLWGSAAALTARWIKPAPSRAIVEDSGTANDLQ